MRRPTIVLLAALLAPRAASPGAPPPDAPVLRQAPAEGPEAPTAARPAPDPTYLPELVARARALGLARALPWVRLGHWRHHLVRGWVGEADGPAFFLSPEGKHDPAAELEATLRGLFDATPRVDELDDAMCRFPARLAWLSERLAIDPARLPARDCPRLDDFRRRVAPVSATLVFSAYYPNNPASTFGHTFLRLNKKASTDAERAELLDYGVDYSAAAATKNPILYMVKGLLGGFRGNFNHLAYYYKVREYGDAESRDLWEYELDLAPAEVTRLVDHLWELGSTWFDYWYLDENCSYHVLGALEAAAPRLRLLAHVGPNVVLPSDTVKALYRNPGLVRRVEYRPSIRTQFEVRAAALPRASRSWVEPLVGDPAAPLPETLAPELRAAVIDAAADLLDLRRGKKLLVGKDPEGARLRQALLERRAALGIPSAPLEVPTPEAERPDRGHGSFRIGLGGAGGPDAPGAVLAELRLALHDLADPPAGYPSYADIEFLPARIRWEPRAQRLDLDHAWLMSVVSLNPVSRFDLRPSWRFRVGARAVRDGGCAGCIAGEASAGAGFAVAAGRALDLLATGDVELLGAPRLSGAGGSWARPGIGPGGLARVRLGDRAALVLEARWRWLPGAEPDRTWDLGATLRVHLVPGLSLGLEARHTPSLTDASALVLGYF
jgi:hypothetical protein